MSLQSIEAEVQNVKYVEVAIYQKNKPAVTLVNNTYNKNSEMSPAAWATFKIFKCAWNEYWSQETVADPGFPVVGRRPRRGGVDSQGGYISNILYVKTKESGPLGSVHQARP